MCCQRLLFVVLVIQFITRAVAIIQNDLDDVRGFKAGILTNSNITGVKVGSCSYSATCTASGYTGVCVNTAAGCCPSGTVTSNLCPGSSTIKCCTQPACQTPSGAGKCMQTSVCSSKGGRAIAGYCVGPSNLQCCVQSTAAGQRGVDISVALTASVASCMRSSGTSFIVPRGFRSSGSVDTHVCNSIKIASSAGIPVRDTYLFPCPRCKKSADTQMKELAAYLRANCNGQWSGRVWLDIEGTQYWLGSSAANQAWYKQLKNACATYSVSCGVYSSKVQWQAIFGSSTFSYGSELPLWYAHYDNNPSFSDFSPFGGWTTPRIKQFHGDTTLCGVGVDSNFALRY